MAFELIFGKKTEPGSIQVYEHFNWLSDKQEISKYRNKIRQQTNGGEKSIQRRQNVCSNLKENATKKFLYLSDYENAYDDVIRVVDIEGSFTSETIQMAYEILVASKRFEEAAAISYLGKYCYGETTGNQLVEIYRQLGYCQHENCEIGTVKCQTFDGKDLQMALSKLEAIEDIDWRRHLFLLTHINLHVKSSMNASYKVFAAQKSNFMETVGKNQNWLDLFDFVDLASMEPFELHCLALFLKLIRHMSSSSSELLGMLTKQQWFQKLVVKIARNLASRNFFKKISRNISNTSLDMLAHEWFLITSHIFRPIFGTNNCKLDYPFNDFNWYCRIASILLFVDGNFSDDDRFGLLNLSNFAIRMLSEAIDSNNSSMAKSIKNCRFPQWQKSCDILLLLTHFSFVEWRNDLVHGQLLDIHEDTVTDRHLLTILLNLQFKIISKFRINTMVPHWLLENETFFLASASRLLFLAAHFVNLTEIVGECALTSTISCIALLMSDPFVCRNGQQVAKLFSNKDFNEPFVMSIFFICFSAMMASSNRSKSLAKRLIPAVMRIIAIGGTASPVEFLQKAILNDTNENKGPPLVPTIFGLQFNGAFSTECLSMLFRHAPLVTKRKWAVENEHFLKQIVVILLKCLASDGSICKTIETAITAILTLNSLLEVKNNFRMVSLIDDNWSHCQITLPIFNTISEFCLGNHKIYNLVEGDGSSPLANDYRMMLKLSSGCLIASLYQQNCLLSSSLIGQSNETAYKIGEITSAFRTNLVSAYFD